MPNLFPAGYENEIVVLEDITTINEKVGYKQGIAFDYDKGGIELNSKNQIKDATGIESWRQWCINCMSIEKGSLNCYSGDIGIETREAFNADSRELAEALLTKTITEGLMADPYGRTSYVEDITFDWINNDSVVVDVTVVGIDDATIDIITTLGEKVL